MELGGSGAGQGLTAGPGTPSGAPTTAPPAGALPAGGTTATAQQPGPGIGSTAGGVGSGPVTTARTTAPIKIGIVLTATSNAASYGITFGNTYTEPQVDDA